MYVHVNLEKQTQSSEQVPVISNSLVFFPLAGSVSCPFALGGPDVELRGGLRVAGARGGGKDVLDVRDTVPEGSGRDRRQGTPLFVGAQKNRGLGHDFSKSTTPSTGLPQ